MSFKYYYEERVSFIGIGNTTCEEIILWDILGENKHMIIGWALGYMCATNILKWEISNQTDYGNIVDLSVMSTDEIVAFMKNYCDNNKDKRLINCVDALYNSIDKIKKGASPTVGADGSVLEGITTIR